MDNTLTLIYCTVHFEALHRWATIPDSAECDFLQHLHRHVFEIKLYKLVNHDDRAEEFIALKHKVSEYLNYTYLRDVKSGIHNVGDQSCEMIARGLLYQFQAVKVEVSEDGENGAIVFDRNFIGI